MRMSQPGRTMTASATFAAARGICAALAVLGFVVVCVNGAPAANNSVQGAPKKEASGGFESGAANAILIEAESGFTDRMTKRARELGLTQATFNNVTGVTDPDNKMTVREIAKLAQQIIKTYPEFYPLYAEREFTWNKIRQTNRNPLTTSMQGV